MEKPEIEIPTDIKRAIIIAMARQNDAGFVRSGELDLDDADIDAMEEVGWLKRMNDLPHPLRAYQLTHAAIALVLPPELKAIVREDIAGDDYQTFQPDPDDNTTMIGSNGHRYAATQLPSKSGWQYRAAYEVLDKLKPDAISVTARMYLAGLMAQAFDDVADKVARKYMKPH